MRQPTRPQGAEATEIQPGAAGLLASRPRSATWRSAESSGGLVPQVRAIGHELNNLLTIILSYTNLAADDLRPGDPILVDLEQVRSAAVRAGYLTQQLLAVSVSGGLDVGGSAASGGAPAGGPAANEQEAGDGDTSGPPSAPHEGV